MRRLQGLKKRELGWSSIYVVMVIGVVGLFQLMILENRWYSSSSAELSSFPTAMNASSDELSTSQHGSLHSSKDVVKRFRSWSIDASSVLQVRSEEKQTPKSAPKNEKLAGFAPENTFLPLKDTSQPGMSDTDTNWFMSGLRGRERGLGSGETFDLPSDDPHGRLLCVRGDDGRDGAKNSYGLFRKAALPRDAIFRRGTTLVADNYWDYHNIWHALSALANFGTWRLQNKCAFPERLLLYHMGELVTSMGGWITHVLQAAFMMKIPLETGMRINASTVCFERTVVQRRGLGGVDAAHITALFDMLRCKTRRYCSIRRPPGDRARMEVLILTRSGPRAFTNATGVAAVVHAECAKVPGCVTRMLDAGNLTFCQQVEVMSRTNVLISVHGAQLTNMMFMSPGSRVMELFPKGWEEFAGVGQEIYKWQADWTRIVHAGRWRDPDGPECPYPTSETLKCLLFFKDREVGLNATHLADWTRAVLRGFGEHRAQEEWDNGLCACDGDDGVFW